MQQALDTHLQIETPEGVEISLYIAGPIVRAMAWSIDFIYRLIFWLLCFMPLSYIGLPGNGVLFILWFILEWFYPLLFEMLAQGATPGKKKMKIQALQVDGSPLNWSSSFIRNILRAVDFLPFFYGTGLISMLLNQHFKRLGDLAAGTIVVYSQTENKPPLFPDITPIPPTIALSREERKSIVNFTERSLSKDRQQELAEHLTPLTQNKKDPVQRLFEMAAWFVGGQK